MSLKERLDEEMKRALKAKDKNRLAAIRMIRGAVRDKEIDDRTELDDDGVVAVIASQVKKRKDALEQLRQGNRPEVVEAETAQIEVLQEFLPEQLSEAELEAAVDKAIAELGATSIRDMGKVMGKLVAALKGRADNAVVSQLVRRKLG